MGNFCKFTGVELTEGVETIKKMCLNCVSLVENEDGTYACMNEAVMEKGREKVMAAALAEGYEIADLKLKPMALKNPTKKCGVYAVNIPALSEELNTILL